MSSWTGGNEGWANAPIESETRVGVASAQSSAGFVLDEVAAKEDVLASASASASEKSVAKTILRSSNFKLTLILKMSFHD